MEKSKPSKALAVRKTVVARAMAIAFGTVALAGGVATTAYAQSNTTGNIYGQVSAGVTAVVIENMGTGAKRTLVPEANGRFLATALTPGQYTVKSMNGKTVSGTSQVEVFIGQGAEAKFASGTALAAVQVVGTRKTIDVSSSNNGANFTAKQLDALPMERSISGIVALAPNTTKGDPAYRGAMSIGGGAASENAFYINGFPVTNPNFQFGSSDLPFGAIAQAQVLTGGFGAEFGRSVGGVMNITTKSGTNKWEAGISTSYSPSSLAAAPKDIYYDNTGAAENAATDGTLYRRRADNKSTKYMLGAYLGGPIIEDKLFMFVALQRDTNKSEGVNLATDQISTGSAGKWGWYDRNDTTDKYLAKFDWNLTDDHRLEMTLMGDNSKRAETLSGYDYTTAKSNGVTGFTADYKNAFGVTPVGADTQILKYTGNFTDNLTMTALYGQAKASKENSFFNPSAPGATPRRITLLTPTAAAPGVMYTNSQPLTTFVMPNGAEDSVISRRLDFEYRLGKHTLRAGVDDNKLSSIANGDVQPGGSSIRYQFTKTPATYAPCSYLGSTLCPKGGVNVPGTLGTQGYFGREYIFSSVTDAYSDQSAFYVEDRYQANKNVLLTFGLRSESYSNKNPAGEAFLEQKNILSPRFGAAWDVNGDSSLKVFGSAGRYSIQNPTHLAVRGAGPSAYLWQFFTYTGVNPDGTPIGRVNVGPLHTPDGETGGPKDPKLAAVLDLKPNQQDEITLGFEKAFSQDLNFGAKLTYRKLLNTIDDYCDPAPIQKWADDRGIDTSHWNTFEVPFICASFNPGQTNTFNVDFNNNKQYTPVTLTTKELGFENVQRTYWAVDLFAEHPLRNGWYGKINYTLSRNEGNTEGQTRSDVGQTDVSATASWDSGELMDNTYGKLPNNRTHQIKAFGFYELTKEWSIGGNLLLASGRPRNCMGYHPNPDSYANGYTSAAFYCDGKPSPRGTLGELPWDKRLDLNFSYKPQSFKGLGFKVDVFNVFNEQSVMNIDEQKNTGGFESPVSKTYGRVINYSEPRSVKLSAEYNHKF